MGYVSAVDILESVKDLLDDNWDTNDNNIEKPHFIDVNNEEDPNRFDIFNQGDLVVIAPDSPFFEETPIGTWVYGHQRHRVSLQIYTYQGRQKLYDLRKEIVRIVHNNIHSMTDFQRIQFVNFQELHEEQLNIWMGRIVIELLNSAVKLNVLTTD